MLSLYPMDRFSAISSSQSKECPVLFAQNPSQDESDDSSKIRILRAFYDAERNDIKVPLTPMEETVFSHLALGESGKEIATALDIRESTVKSHLKHIFAKFRYLFPKDFSLSKLDIFRKTHGFTSKVIYPVQDFAVLSKENYQLTQALSALVTRSDIEAYVEANLTSVLKVFETLQNAAISVIKQPIKNFKLLTEDDYELIIRAFGARGEEVMKAQVLSIYRLFKKLQKAIIPTAPLDVYLIEQYRQIVEAIKNGASTNQQIADRLTPTLANSTVRNYITNINKIIDDKGLLQAQAT